MTALLDTSFLFALTDKSDRNYRRVLDVIKILDEPLVLPIVVLPEICYLTRPQRQTFCVRSEGGWWFVKLLV